MSDEESFVVLSKSPLNSLRSACANDSLVDITSCGILDISGNSKIETNYITSLAENVTNANQASNSEKVTIENGKTDIKMSNGVAISHKGSSAKENLAASFIMGELDADVLKTSVYSQFPSMSSLEASADDVIKLQNLMSEYIELKNTLAKVNGTMKQFYTKTQQWREETQFMEQKYKDQIAECQVQIATLRNDNLELKRELNTKIEEIKLTNDLRQQDHNDLIREISAKTALLSNMSAQLENVEQEQLTSYEYVGEKETDAMGKQDYVDRSEHESVVKQFEHRMSQLLAENLELKTMQKYHRDEIDCLKVNLISAEELLKQSRADINLLKAKDIEKTESFAQYENDRDRMREEIVLLRQQVDIYSKDFEMERLARQNLAGEKDQLLNDLRSLQRRNQSLIEETQKRVDEISVKSVSSTPVLAPIPPTPIASTSVIENTEVSDKLHCPICDKAFSAYSVLSSHVNDCLDQHQN